MNVARIVAVAGLLAFAATAGAQSDAIDPRADQIVREMCRTLGSAETMRLRIVTELRVSMHGMKQTMSSEHSIAIERPNKVAMLLRDGMMGATVVSDGRRVFTHVPAMGNRYTVHDAPERLALMAEAEVPLDVGFTGEASFLMADDPYSELMSGVTGLTYRGTVDVDGVSCHHLAATQDDYDWELWIDAGPTPVPLRLVPDLSRMAGQMADRGAEMEAVTRFEDWALGVELVAGTFDFDPPPGAEEVESLFDDMEMMFGRGEDELTGHPAPEFTLDLLDGGSVELAAHRGKIVVLDFWASWCKPCVHALPGLADVADKYADRGVAFYAVNIQEAPERVRSFLKSRELDLPVALDTDGEVAMRYGVQAIPMTVVIGADGTVQAVHTGAAPDLKGRLSGEIDALLAGEKLADARPALERPDAADLEPRGLERVWSLPGRYAGAVADTEAVYALSASGRCDVIDRSGQVMRSFELDPGGSFVRLATFAEGERALVSFDTWGDVVTAHDTAGKLRWRHPGGDGIDDVWAEDLDRDGIDEVIIGYNGATGLRVLDARGEVLWRTTKIGNVWHVCAADVDGDGDAEVLTTSAGGRVHVFEGDGQWVRDVSLPLYANVVRVAATDDGTVLLTGGTADGETLIASDFRGERRWTLRLGGSGRDSLDEVLAAPGAPWVAASLRNGSVAVIDTNSGRVIAAAKRLAPISACAWLPGGAGEPPLLVVVARTGALEAHRVTPEAAD